MVESGQLAPSGHPDPSAAAGRRATGRKRSRSLRNPWEAGATAVGRAAAETWLGWRPAEGLSGHGKACVHAEMRAPEGLQQSGD